MVGPGIWRETVKNVKNEKDILQDQDYGKKNVKHGEGEANTVCPGIWQETLKKGKNKNCTLLYQEQGEKIEKRGK